ncbi:hypothetical protein ACEWY4_011918 [Coilia grayii]|uniref:Calponin-homology (CH) domain-containing protein n=1 Tax=Coilia grayii TaxID=363190 RepID=A0ABD1JZ20_9TELE
MPGVSMEPMDECAESGLECVIGDLLCPLGEGEGDGEEVALAGGGAVEVEEVERRMQEAVCEVHAELRDFGRLLEQRVQEHLGPLMGALQELQQDNLRLRLQQERLVRQVDSLCHALQLPEAPPIVLPSPQAPPPLHLDLSHMLTEGLFLNMDQGLTSDPDPGMTPDSLTSDKQPDLPAVPSEEVSLDVEPCLMSDAVDGLTCDANSGVRALESTSIDLANHDSMNGVTIGDAKSLDGTSLDISNHDSMNGVTNGDAKSLEGTSLDISNHDSMNGVTNGDAKSLKGTSLDISNHDPMNGVTNSDAKSSEGTSLHDAGDHNPMNGTTPATVEAVTSDLADGTCADAEVEAVPHPPAFSTRRSSSLTSMPTTVSRSNSMPTTVSRSNSMVESEPSMFVMESSVPNGSSFTRSLTSDQSRSTSTQLAQAQEHTIRVTSDQSRASPTPARAQEHTIKVVTDQSHQSSTRAQVQASSGRMTAEQLAAIEDEELLDKMLDETKDFEERRLIRAAMRDLRKKKREAKLGCTQEEIDMREKERDQRLEELRKQREERVQKGKAGEVVTKTVEKSADGSTISQVTKTNRFTQSDDGSRSTRSTILESSYVQKTGKGMVQSKSYSYSSSSSSAKKVGSVFDREDDSAQERRQVERKKELMRAQTMPKSTANQARKAMMEKLDAGGVGNAAVARVNKVQRSTSFGVPNANSIKQMLLDWCRAKTRDYQNVEIQNFSTSWCDGMAFCALVHNFFPQAFDYDSLSPANRRQNFQLAFDTAEELADVPRLLDVEDMVGMREPDWKCVYTYLQEFYRGLVLKGLVKTKGSA